MKLFYGWVIVAAGIVITCIGFGTALSLGVFLQPIAADTGWSRASISTAAMIDFLCMGFASLFWGWASDRIGTRLVVIAGGIVVGGGLVLASGAATVGQFLLSFAVVGVGVGSFYAPLTASVTRWFIEHRNLAVALVSAGIGLGSTAIAPLARWLISAHDWRTALFTLGVIAWVVIVAAGLLIRKPPSSLQAAGATLAGGGREFTVAQALRTPQFAAIGLTHCACCVAHSGPIFHMITEAIDCGVAPMAAATVLGVAGLSSVGGRVVCGLLADRFGAKETLIAGLMVQAVAISLYLFVRDLNAFYALGAVFGLAYGGIMPLYATLVREYFGAKIMGTVFGAVAMLSTLGMALGPWAGGWIYDNLGGYFWLYIASCAVGLGAVAIACTFRPPQPAEQQAAPALA
ncbi:MAG TPA: MFS transporter [Stellaceae bacterium]|jgi:MFS family permease|nr:MFS transporter [Stellaceae bacterium]